MKVVYRFDNNGFYVEDVVVQDREKVPSDCATIKPQDGLFKAQYANGAWVEGMAQTDILTDLKSIKKSELSKKCNEAIAGGFASSALGEAHTYPSHDKAQSNFNTEMNRFLTDSNYLSCKFFTIDAGWLGHTKDQFFQVFHEGHDFGNAQWEKLFSLFSQVDASQTKADLDAIVW
jgi:hypothetical protein